MFSKHFFLLNSVAIILGAVSLLAVIGFVANNRVLLTLGQATGFSPMPLPFREFETGDENISGAFTGSLFKDKHELTLSSDDIVKDFSLHTRPHRAAIPFYTLANYFSAIPNQIKVSGFRYICKHYDGDTMIAHISYTAHTYDFKVICK